MPAASCRIMPARSISRCEDDLRLFRGLTQDRQEIAGQAAWVFAGPKDEPVRVKADRQAKDKGRAERDKPGFSAIIASTCVAF